MMQAMLLLFVLLIVSGAHAFLAAGPVSVKPSAATITAAAAAAAAAAQAIASQAANAQPHCRQCTALQMSSFSLDHSIDYGDIDEDVS
jgi:uncharacterized protein (UPF0333 family)